MASLTRSRWATSVASVPLPSLARLRWIHTSGRGRPRPRRPVVTPPTRRTEDDGINGRLEALEDELRGNPNLVILSSALRRCMISNKILPRDMMLQLKSVHLPERESKGEAKGEDPAPSASPSHSLDDLKIDLVALARKTANEATPREVILPANLLHPSINPPKPGRSTYVTLSRPALEDLILSGKVNILKRSSKTTRIPNRLVGIVSMQLRRRVVQEADILRRGDAVEGQGVTKSPSPFNIAQSAVLCCDSHTYDRLLDRNDITRRTLYDVSDLFPDEEQRNHLIQTLAGIPVVKRYSEMAAQTFGDIDVLAQQNILCLPFTPTLGPINVALWRSRCFFGHPRRQSDDGEEDQEEGEEEGEGEET